MKISSHNQNAKLHLKLTEDMSCINSKPSPLLSMTPFGFLKVKQKSGQDRTDDFS